MNMQLGSEQEYGILGWLWYTLTVIWGS